MWGDAGRHRGLGLTQPGMGKPKKGRRAIQPPVRPERNKPRAWGKVLPGNRRCLELFLESLSKGVRDFESHPIGERRTVAHASTWLSTSGISAFQWPF